MICESELRSAIASEAKKRHILIHYVANRRSAKTNIVGSGFPDIVLAGTNGMLLVELKVEEGKLSEKQEEWRDKLLSSGQAWSLWRSSDLLDGTITKMLDSIA